jgi:ubiquinone/menaquinone biosynthesis C-methylase UbiE
MKNDYNFDEFGRIDFYSSGLRPSDHQDSYILNGLKRQALSPGGFLVVFSGLLLRGFYQELLAGGWFSAGPFDVGMLTLAVAPRNRTGNLSNGRAVAYFDRLADDYDRSQYRTGRRTFISSRHDHIIRMLSEIAASDTASVLEAGCGPGNLLPQLASRFGRVCALDASSRMLDVARTHAADFRNITYQVGNIEALPFGDESFDLVCSAGVIEYLPNIERAVQEIHRVLRPGGLLILSTTNANAPSSRLRPARDLFVRIPFVARMFGIEHRNCRLWHHRIPEFKQRLRTAGLLLEGERHFYLTLPSPLNRLFPTVTRKVERWLDGYMHTSLRHLAEGYIAVATKPSGSGA